MIVRHYDKMIAADREYWAKINTSYRLQTMDLNHLLSKSLTGYERLVLGTLAATRRNLMLVFEDVQASAKETSKAIAKYF
jgi:hypothetical protein